ncbi:hypothetical protein THAOC_19284, partial [Thalassiosira oceanica]
RPEEGTAGGGGTTQATAVSGGRRGGVRGELGDWEHGGGDERGAASVRRGGGGRRRPRPGLGRLIPHTFFPRFLPCLLFQSSEKSGPNVHSRRRPRRGRPRGGRRVRRRPRLPRRDQQEGRHADLRRVPQLAPPGREQEPVQEGERRRDAGQGLLQEDLSELREEEEEEADGRVRRRRTGLCRHGGEVSTGGRGRDAVVAGHGAEVCHLAREVRVRGKSVLPSSHVCSPS